MSIFPIIKRATEEAIQRDAEDKVPQSVTTESETTKALREQAQQDRQEADAAAQAADKTRKRARWASIVDGISAIANLVTTASGGDSVYDGSSSARHAANVQQSNTYANAMRDKYKQSNLLYARAKDADMSQRIEAERQKRLDNSKIAADQYRMQIGVNRDKRAEELQPYKVETARNKAETTKEEAKSADTYYNNRATRVGTRATSSSRSRSTPKMMTLEGVDYDTVQEYRAAVYAAAKRLGISTTREVTTTTNDGYGRPKVVTRVVAVPIDEIAAEVNGRYQPSKPSQPTQSSLPSQSSQPKKKIPMEETSESFSSSTIQLYK